MSYLRFQDDDESSVAGTVTSVLLGAVAGFAVGMLVAQRVGGFSGLAQRVRRRGSVAEDVDASGPTVADDFSEFDEDFDDELEEEGVPNEGLEERVLEAFRNDPILSERAIDIGGIGDETIELAGWVNTEDEAEHAVIIARGVPGVETVVNRIAVGDVEERIRDHSRRFEAGDDALTEARWEGHTVGTGRRRQGTSDEVDRHATPRVELEERWTNKDVELQQAADETEGLAERRASTKKAVKGDRTGGSPIAPTGVPKGDHVVDPPSGV
ncbi:MAG: transport-associated protein [Gemmatimonadetes bacterium]|nr:transport-associated protein [Gemmatimonadota bacterium]